MERKAEGKEMRGTGGEKRKGEGIIGKGGKEKIKHKFWLFGFALLLFLVIY